MWPRPGALPLFPTTPGRWNGGTKDTGSFFPHPTSAFYQWVQTKLSCLVAHLSPPRGFINQPDQKAWPRPQWGTTSKEQRTSGPWYTIYWSIRAWRPLQRLLALDLWRMQGQYIWSLGVDSLEELGTLGWAKGLQRFVSLRNNLYQASFELIHISLKMHLPQEDFLNLAGVYSLEWFPCPGGEAWSFMGLGTL